MEEPDRGDSFCGSQVLQVHEEGDGIKAQQVLSQCSQGPQVLNQLHITLADLVYTYSQQLLSLGFGRLVALLGTLCSSTCKQSVLIVVGLHKPARMERV